MLDGLRAWRRPACSAPPSTPCCAASTVSVDDLRRPARACRRRGATPSTPVLPSLEDVFLDVVDRAGGAAGMKKALAVGRKELRQIARDRRTLLILVFVPGVLPAALRLRAQLRHPPRRSSASRIATARPRAARIVSAFVNSGYFDLAAPVYDAGRRPSGCSTSNTARAVLVIPEGLGRDVGAGQPGHRAGDHQRRQRQHRDDRDGLCHEHPAHRRAASWRPAACSWRRRSPSSRASGTTRSCAARCSWCRA